MTTYKLLINGKRVRDRLIQLPHRDDDIKVITEGNVVPNILKLYAELDPLACYAEWGQNGNKVVQKARQNGSVLTIDGQAYEFKREFDVSTTQERCYYCGRVHNDIPSNEEPYWVLAPAVEPGYWLVISTSRSDDYLNDILVMCKNDFFKRYGIEKVALEMC